MKYTPEQITELLEEVNNAIQLGYYPKFEQIKQLTEIVQQQAKQLSEAWKAYDNLKAEMEALGAEIDEDDIVRSMNSGPVDLYPDEGSQETE